MNFQALPVQSLSGVKLSLFCTSTEAIVPLPHRQAELAVGVHRQHGLVPGIGLDRHQEHPIGLRALVPVALEHPAIIGVQHPAPVIGLPVSPRIQVELHPRRDAVLFEGKAHRLAVADV